MQTKINVTLFTKGLKHNRKKTAAAAATVEHREMILFLLLLQNVNQSNLIVDVDDTQSEL